MPQKGYFELYSELRPALPAGSYLLAADHTLQASPPDGPGDLAIDGSDFHFSIVSPMYTMPPDQILSTFPPASAVGDWHQRLPQIVFKRRTMPWERNADIDKPFAQSPPWLALVVLAEGEGTLSDDVDVHQCVTAGSKVDADIDTAKGKYLDVSDSVVKSIFPTVEDLRLLAHIRKVDLTDTELALGDDDGYLSVVVANRLPQPGPPQNPDLPASKDNPLTSKRYTAYLVNVQGQLGALPTKEESEFVFVLEAPDLVQNVLFTEPVMGPVDAIAMKPGQFLGQSSKSAGAVHPTAEYGQGSGRGVETAAAALAVGPALSGTIASSDSSAVSKWQDGVALSELGSIAGELIGIFLEPHFRFPVLASWDFVCTGDGTFEDLMVQLHSGMLATEDTALDPALSPEIAPTGHVALDATTRRGDQTIAWYRGPFVPQPTTRDTVPAGQKLPIAHTADQLRRVVPDGREDLSRASAFEIGRLLALSKPGLVADLMAWRNELFGAARVKQFSIDMFDELAAGFSTAAVEGKRSLEELIAATVLPAYAERAGGLPGAAAFPSARVPDALSDIGPAEVLTGLGIDPQVAWSATKQAGGVWGMSAVDVAATTPSAQPLSNDEAALGALHAELSDHLDRLAVDALKSQPGRTPDKAVTSARRRRKADLLDQLLTASTAQPPEEDDE